MIFTFLRLVLGTLPGDRVWADRANKRMKTELKMSGIIGTNQFSLCLEKKFPQVPVTTISQFPCIWKCIFYCTVMSIMVSEILKLADSPKTEKS